MKNQDLNYEWSNPKWELTSSLNFWNENMRCFTKGSNSDFLSSPFRVKPGAFKIINCSWFCKCSLRFQWQNEVSKRSIIVEHVRVEPFRMLWRSIEANSRGPRGGIGRRGWNRNSNFIECFSSLLFSLSFSFLFLQCSFFFFLGWNNFNIFFSSSPFFFYNFFFELFRDENKIFILYCWIFNLWSFFYE